MSLRPCTPEIVSGIVACIDSDRDPETAHVLLDDLWHDVLEAIGAGECDEPSECARLAVAALKLVPVRWYA